MPVSVSRCEFAGTPLAARDGREFVAKTLAGHPRIDDLVQITSELIANAVRHSHSKRPGGRVAVTVVEGTDFDGIAFAGVKVTDDGSEQRPYVKRWPRVEESGYGLALVEELADRWGHYITRDRRTVWAAVTVS